MKRTLLILVALSSVLSADFTRDSNGVVTDNITHLKWQDNYSDVGDNVPSFNWEDAIAYCEQLTLSGYSDWRLPNKNELLSIIDYNQSEPGINFHFNVTTGGDYWTSTTDAALHNQAWYVRFNYGDSGSFRKDFTHNQVRCVRAGN